MQNEKHYVVTWVIDAWASSPEEAAAQIFAENFNNETEADYFHVKDERTGEVSRIYAKAVIEA